MLIKFRQYLSGDLTPHRISEAEAQHPPPPQGSESADARP